MAETGEGIARDGKTNPNRSNRARTLSAMAEGGTDDANLCKGLWLVGHPDAILFLRISR